MTSYYYLEMSLCLSVLLFMQLCFPPKVSLLQLMDILLYDIHCDFARSLYVISCTRVREIHLYQEWRMLISAETATI